MKAMRERKKHRLPPGDDGRTIASMDFGGSFENERFARESGPAAPVRPEGAPPAEQLSGKALMRYMFSAVGAGLLIVAAFGLAGFLFIEFCVHAWFR